MITDITAIRDAETPARTKTSATPGGGLKFPDSLVYKGYSAPVRMECDVYDLEVEGEIPRELDGAYIRACADPSYPPLLGSDIFLNGDGMLHQVRLQDGHADLKTRYVRTEKFKLEHAARRALFGAYRNPFTDDPSVAGKNRGTANTSAFWHAGRLFALKEDSRPTLIDPVTLETRGSYDFDGRLQSKTFTAHPKIDPRTGEVVAFGYNTQGVASPIIELFFISPEGELTRTESFEAPYASMVHDFMVSANHIVFTICPMINDWERVKRGEPFFHWDGRKPTMVAVIPRAPGGAQAVRWFRSERPCMETHTFNAWEEGQRLHLEHFVTDTGWLSQFPDINDANAHEKPPFAYRWTLDLAAPGDGFEVTRIFPQIGEMPMIDLRHMMGRTRHYYFGTTNLDLGPMLEWGPKGPPFTCIGHFDAETGRQQFYYAGPHSAPEEPLFVPRTPDAPEAHGWILTIVGRRHENRTDLVILDAQDIAAGPVATVKFPCRVHEGFHGCWVPGAALG
jgi:carotenoid cleavage dioxygenase-like enzyme